MSKCSSFCVFFNATKISNIISAKDKFTNKTYFYNSLNKKTPDHYKISTTLTYACLCAYRIFPAFVFVKQDRVHWLQQRPQSWQRPQKLQKFSFFKAPGILYLFVSRYNESFFHPYHLPFSLIIIEFQRN